MCRVGQKRSGIAEFIEGCYSREVRIPVLARRDATGLLLVANQCRRMRHAKEICPLSAGRSGSVRTVVLAEQPHRYTEGAAVSEFVIEEGASL